MRNPHKKKKKTQLINYKTSFQFNKIKDISISVNSFEEAATKKTGT